MLLKICDNKKMRQDKILLFGSVCSGKSTVALLLRGILTLPLIELDIQMKEIDPNVFQGTTEYQNTIKEPLLSKFLQYPKIILVTSMLTEARLREFSKNGFVIFQTYCDPELMLQRRKERYGGKISDQKVKSTLRNWESHQSIIRNQKLSHLINDQIDTTDMSPLEVMNRILGYN